MRPSFLSGIRVVDLGGEALAVAGRILADLGAEVVLVEDPDGGPGRRVPPLLRDAGGQQVSAHFLYSAAGKRSVTADVTRPAGRDLVRRLLDTADVVLVTDVDEDLAAVGLDERTLRATNDGIVVTSLTPFGRSGPRRRWRGTDLVAWAASGGLGVIGDPDRRPVSPGGRIAEAAGSLNAVLGTVLALRARHRIGKGQAVDISLQEAVLGISATSGPFFTLENLAVPSNRRVGRYRATAQGMFATKDGMVELLPFMPGQWDSLAEWIRDDLGVEEATMDVFRGSVLARAPFAELINGWVAQLAAGYTKHDFMVQAQRRAIPCGVVNEPTDLLGDPHLDAVGGWDEAATPTSGRLRFPRPPLRFDGMPMDTGDVPAPGEANDEVWGTELGLSEKELAALRADRTI